MAERTVGCPVRPRYGQLSARHFAAKIGGTTEHASSYTDGVLFLFSPAGKTAQPPNRGRVFRRGKPVMRSARQYQSIKIQKEIDQ